jgi:hypothetical protein
MLAALNVSEQHMPHTQLKMKAIILNEYKMVIVAMSNMGLG